MARDRGGHVIDVGAPMTEPRTLRQSWTAWLSIFVLLASLVGRITAPSDLWDHTQPKTVAYTTDIFVHGGSRWILPYERGELPASKPPLYNWIAVPAVMVMGVGNHLAHRMPSIIAWLACWLLIVRLCRTFDDNDRLQFTRELGEKWGSTRGRAWGERWGWIAGAVFVANLSMFKLSALVRPDMVLTLWLTLAWWMATVVLMRAAAGRHTHWRWAFGFWTMVGLAALTKGPVALVPVAYAIIAARTIGGRFSAFRTLHPWMCLWSLALGGSWIAGVAILNPEHLRNTLWGEEIYGRITGTGSLGSPEGPASLIKNAPMMLIYFLTRLLPWSFVFILATVVLFRIPAEHRNPRERWAISASLFTILVIIVFSLSAGKRADYLAVCVPTAAIVAGWWLTRTLFTPTAWLRPAFIAAVVLNVAVIIVHEHRFTGPPSVAFSRDMSAFVHDLRAVLAKEDRPVLMCRLGSSPVPALIGISRPPSFQAVRDTIEAGDSCLVLAGWRVIDHQERDLAATIRRLYPSAQIEVIADSGEMERGFGWPGRMSLYRITPAG
jgi:4-amino-4-deoxy-L-arabinose transferase-like glycosyltransferase